MCDEWISAKDGQPPVAMRIIFYCDDGYTTAGSIGVTGLYFDAFLRGTINPQFVVGWQPFPKAPRQTKPGAGTNARVLVDGDVTEV